MTAGPRPRTLLAIDTASSSGGVALLRGDLLLGEETWQAASRQTTQVLPAAVRLWTRAGIGPDALDAIAVSAGPGSYSGLRAGISLAKGLAMAAGLPVVAIPAPEAVAYQHRAEARRLCAVVDAGRGQLYVARYRWPRDAQEGKAAGCSGLVPEGDYAVLTPDELGERLAAGAGPGPDLLVCGELYPDVAVRLRARAPDGIRFVSPAAAPRRPAFLAALAAARLELGGLEDAATIQPVYLRRTP